ncbi:MAG: hypothetical protein HYY40_14420 [Bacteroidetes bacterium]|nr:hypothetical protein [Bacteroidota bacterium]
MNIYFKYKLIGKVALVIAFIFLYQVVYPTIAYALTSGPMQPEFSSFEPVATTNMVNEFTGDFTYNLPVLNIPGANGGGYALSLSYHSGTSPEEEASWVGYGWTLNPGAILRNKRGFPDDYNGSTVTYWNKVPPNWTISASGSVSPEGFSVDVPLSAQGTLRYNNYKGFGYTLGVGVSFVEGLFSLGYSITDGSGSFSASINPGAALSNQIKKGEKVYKDPAVKEAMDKINDGRKLNSADLKALDKYLKKERVKEKLVNRLSSQSISLVGSNYGIFSFADAIRPASVTSYIGGAANISVGLLTAPTAAQAGPSFNVGGHIVIQANRPHDNVDAYGFIYSSNADPSSDAAMDYYAEKDIPFYKRNKFLSIPFANNDNFVVTGEGVGGGFRPFNRRVGTFRPTVKTSPTFIFNGSLEVEFIQNFGGGGDLGMGTQELKMTDWADIGNTGDYAFASTANGDEPFFFRFNNDPGGNVRYATDNSPFRAGLSVLVPGPMLKQVAPLIPVGAVLPSVNNGTRSGRSSYIAYHTNGEMINRPISAYEKRLINFIDRSGSPDGIGEIAVFNEDGMCHLYGLPVYSKNEFNFQYDMFNAADPVNRYLAYKSGIPEPNDEGTTKVKAGEYHPSPYATTFLLTQITTPDYVDRTLNGPTGDDYGGWTKFNYVQVHTAYKWRVPYTGLLYNRGSLSDPDDDAGTVMGGEKEIYYLQSVETKTHIATFYTSGREDGLDAGLSENTASQNANAKGIHPLKRLDRIVLYAKDASGNQGREIKRVHFNYDYSLMPGQPNNSSGGGKLTLRQLWFEYEGTVSAKISPYRFFYEYKPAADFQPPVSTQYSSLVAYGNDLASAGQNPSYNDGKFLDPWGNYQMGGAARHENMQKGIYQGTSQAGFDPAAWQLKRIQLPSGGDILIHYEQKDYAYVQDRPAMSPVSLLDASCDNDLLSGCVNKYYLNTENIGIDPGDAAYSAKLAALKALIENYYVKRKEKIYFKFLYRLKGTNPPPLESCNAEYIDGYVKVADVVIENVSGTDRVKLTLGDPGHPLEIPYAVCVDFVKKERAGKMVLKDVCTSDDGVGRPSHPLENIIDDPTEFIADAKSLVISFGAFIAQFSGILGLADAAITCASVNFEKSYFRIPVLNPKRGGGVRVKRILMYDPGIETGDAALYGSEYIYQAVDDKFRRGEVISSGVALNEPPAIREENPLVIPVKRFQQSLIGKIISGRIKDDTEGPLGESILPSPSIGYSKVIVKNIHAGRTNTGIVVNEFFTAKDFPFDGQYPLAGGPAVEMTEVNKKADWFLLPALLVNINVDKLWLTQGFRFVINSMHGQPERISTYSADYNDIHNPSKKALSSMQEFAYFEPGEKVPVWRSPFDNITSPVNKEDPGMEMEIAMERKSVDDITTDGNVEFDVDIGFLGIFPVVAFATAFATFNYMESRLRTHTTSKIVRYPAIQKSVLTYQDGIYHLTENLAFNPETGKPLISRTRDGFNALDLQQSADHIGTYVNYTFPASHQYPAMGQRAQNERKKISVQISETGCCPCYLKLTGSGICNALSNLFPGDLITISGSSTNPFQVYNISGNKLEVVHAQHIHTSCPIFASLPPFNPPLEVEIEIIHSGRTNQLNTVAGSITTYGREFQTAQPGNPTLTADMQALAASLTAAISAGGSQPVTIPAGIGVINPANSICYLIETPSGNTITITNDNSQPGGTIDVTGSVTGIPQHRPGSDPQTFTFTSCSVPKSGGNGHFELDPQTGQILYFTADNNCFPHLTCLNFCPVLGYKMDGVIAANAQNFQNDWYYGEEVADDNPLANPFEYGRLGKWRQESNFVYKAGITGGGDDDNNERIYKDAGVFKDFSLFKWKNLPANDPAKWLKLNTVTAYSPDGNAVEEQNILGIYSAAKFGYNNTVPYLVAQNARYSPLAFESFENIYTKGSNEFFEDGMQHYPDNGTRDNTYAHSGIWSFKLGTTSVNGTDFRLFTLTNELVQKGISVKTWVKSTDLWLNPQPLSPGSLLLKLYHKNTPGTIIKDLVFEKIAQTGEWTLYEARFTDFTLFTVGEVYGAGIDYDFAQNVWIDDIRFQPLDAQMICYVYDVNTLRLLASFDDQHFGLYYQYNGEGKLVRKLIETEKGIKTIQETQYHTPLGNKP